MTYNYIQKNRKSSLCSDSLSMQLNYNHHNRSMKIVILIQLLALFLLSCHHPTNSNRQNNIIQSKDQDIISVRIADDTLTIVSTNQIVYFPFGKFSTKRELIDGLRGLEITEENGPEIRMSYGKSRIKLFHDSEQNTFHIVSGDIRNKEIEFENGLKVGLSKSTVLNKYLNDIQLENMRFKVLVLESGLTGIWHYYEFKNDTLARIKFDTDYQLEK